MDKKAVVHLLSGILCSGRKRKKTPIFCNSMDEPGENYAK